MKKFRIFFIPLLFALTSFAGTESRAFMARGYGGGGYYGGAMTPFYGTPFYPGPSPMMTGQMNYGYGYGGPDMMQVANSLNWSGAQPMGFSYLPPMGLGAIQNTLNYNSLSNAYGSGRAY